MAYVAQAERMDEKELKVFQRELVRDPSAPPISHGTNALMGLMTASRGGTPVPRGQ